MNNKKLDLVQLDERILFDVAPLDAHAMDTVELPTAPVDGDVAWTHATTENNDSAFADLEIADTASIESGHSENLDQLAEMLDGEWSNEDQLGQTKQLIIVDQGVDDATSLLDKAIGTNDPGLFEILLIDSNDSALDRINQRLSSNNYSGLHFVAHGEDGQLQLGNTTWNSTYLANHIQSFSGWKLALSPEADLFIYGCNVAETEFGQSFIQELADATGADVAASIDVTGSSELGGDWDLEYRHGTFDLEAHPFDFHALDAWHYTLDIVTGNTMTTGTASGESSHDSLAASAKGDYVVVWTESTGFDSDIYAQQFNADGSAKAAAFRVNDLTTGDQENATVAMDSHGNFVVVWTDTDTDTIYAKTYNADGSLDTNEFTVANDARSAVVAMNNDGYWTTVWDVDSSNSIMATVFNPDDTIRVSNITIASGGAINRQDMAADMNKFGEIAIVWETESSSDDVFLNKIDIDGNSITGEVEVANGFFKYNDPDVAINDLGDMVVTATSPQIGTHFVKVFWVDADGTVSGFDTPTTVFSGTYQYNPSIDMAADSGDFVLAWHGNGPGDTNGVFQTIYDEGSDSFSAQTLVNTQTSGLQNYASVHYGGPNEILTVYSGHGAGFQSTLFVGDAIYSVPHGPNDFVLDSTLVNEHEYGAIVGNLVGVDPAYVVPATFSTDDPRFEVVNNQLKLVDGAELDYEVESQIDVEVSVEDATSPGTYIRNTYTINVIDLDESSMTRVTLDNLTIDENLGNGQLVANAGIQNPEMGETYSYVLLEDAGGRFDISSGGMLTVENSSLLNFEAQNSHRVKVEATDSGGSKFIREFDIDLNDVNEPTNWVHLDNTNVNEETAGAIIGNLTIFDPDVGDTFTFSTTDARFEVVANQLKLVDGVELDYEVETSVNVGVIVLDGASNFFQRNLTISVDDLAEVPTTVSLDNTSVDEDAVNNFVIGNASANGGAIGETFTYTLNVDAGGRFGVTAGGDLYVKDASMLDHETDDQHLVSIQATGSLGSSVSTVYFIDITDVNEAPTNLVLDNSSVDEDAANNFVIGSASAIDVDDGDTLTYTLAKDSFGRFGITSDGDLYVKDASRLDFESNETHRIEIQVTDSLGLFLIEPIDITVNDVNEAPTNLTLDNTSVDEDAANNFVVGSASATDPDDGDSITYTLLNDAGGRFGITAGGDLFVKDAAQLDHEADEIHRIEIRATDIGGAFTTTQFDILVGDVNEAPSDVFLSNSNVAEDAANNYVIGSASVADVDDGDSANYVLLNDAGGIFGITSGGDLYVKDASLLDHETSSSLRIEVQATDSGGEVITKQFDITVDDVNEAPTNLTLDNSSVDEDAANNFVIGTVSVLDVDDSDTVTYTLDQDSFGRFGITSDGDLYVKDASKIDFESNTSHRIGIRATDSAGNFVVNPIDITINDVNEAPVTGDDVYATDEEKSIVIDPTDLLSNDSDPENDALTITNLLAPDNGTIVRNGDGTYTYTPDDEFNGIDSIRYEVEDSFGNKELGTISVAVGSVNDDPVANDDRFSLYEGDVLTVSVSVFGNDSDIDGDLLRSGSVVSGPDHGNLNWNNDGTFTYRHDGSENHSDQFQYRVSDGNGGFSVATVNLDIMPVNDAPDASGESFGTDSLTPITISAEDLLANDYDAEGDRLTVVIKKLPRHGTLEIVDGKIVYTPDPGFVGVDRIKYYVFDGTDYSDNVKVRINVIAPPIPMDNSPDTEMPNTEETPTEETPVDETPSEENEDSPTDGEENSDNEVISSSPKSSSQPNGYLFEDEEDDFLGFDVSLLEDDNTSYQFASQAEIERFSFTSNLKTVSYRTVDADPGFDLDSDAGTLSVFETIDDAEFAESAIFDNMSRELDSFDHDFHVDGSVDQVTYATLSSITGALTVGYVLWMVRGGMLMASFVSSLPAWQSVDPLNIVDFGTDADPSGDDESLESMIQEFSTDV